MDALPAECVWQILGYLCLPKPSLSDIRSFALTSHSYRNLVYEMPHWRKMCKVRFSYWSNTPKPIDLNSPLQWKETFKARHLQSQRIHDLLLNIVNLGENRYDHMVLVIEHYVEALDCLYQILKDDSDPFSNLTLKFYVKTIINAIERRLWINRWRSLIQAMAIEPPKETIGSYQVNLFDSYNENFIISNLRTLPVHLEEGLVIADCFHLGSEEKMVREELHTLGSRLQESVMKESNDIKSMSVSERIKQLNTFFYVTEQFKVDTGSVEGAFLSQFLKSRLGNPLLVMCVYSILARYLFLRVELLNCSVPVMKVDDLFIEVFEGSQITEADVISMIMDTRIPYDASLLEVISIREVWLRLLRDLLIQRHRGSIHTLYKAICQVLVIAPQYPDIAFQKLQLIQNFFKEDVNEIEDLARQYSFNRPVELKLAILKDLNRNWLLQTPKSWEGHRPEYLVGECVQLIRLLLRGIIIGWQRTKEGVYSYWVLIERNDKRSVTPSSLRTLPKEQVTHIEHEEIGKYFEKFVPGIGFIMNKEYQLLYPEDHLCFAQGQ